MGGARDTGASRWPAGGTGGPPAGHWRGCAGSKCGRSKETRRARDVKQGGRADQDLCGVHRRRRRDRGDGRGGCRARTPGIDDRGARERGRWSRRASGSAARSVICGHKIHPRKQVVNLAPADERKGQPGHRPRGRLRAAGQPRGGAVAGPRGLDVVGRAGARRGAARRGRDAGRRRLCASLRLHGARGGPRQRRRGRADPGPDGVCGRLAAGAGRPPARRGAAASAPAGASRPTSRRPRARATWPTSAA
jgi:hypothetical protein